MIKETVTMSHKELDRLHIIQESLNRHITQEQAAARIGISIRQVKRLVQRYRNEGPSGLVSRRRGKRPNNSFSTEFRATVISLLKGRYADFGPGLAPIFPYTFYHLTHYWFAAADIPVANDTPVHYADAIRCNVRRPPQGSLPLLTRRVSA